jgi:uncharacterized protein YjbI with pentapeptide repeats
VGEELSASDKELLADIARFNEVYAWAGWHIQDKDVYQDLSRILLVNSSLTNCRILHASLQSARVNNTQFIGVEFQQAKFTNATLQGVVFKDCKFLLSGFEGAHLIDCVFENCELDDLNAKKAIFERCRFTSYSDTSGVYDEASFTGCEFEGGRMHNGSFFSSMFQTVSMRKFTLEICVFSDLRGGDLLFEEDTFDNCGFGDSRFGALTLRGGEITGVTFNRFDAGPVSIENCAAADALTVQQSDWKGARIVGCPNLSELTINKSRMVDLELERNQMEYFEMKRTTVMGKSRIADCMIDGMGLDHSKLIGLEMVNCLVSRYLDLDGVTADAVVLSGIQYAPDLRFSAQGVTYLNGSARFRE